MRTCPYGSCREVGHTVLLSGEAISLWMVLPLSEKYHRRIFRFYTVLRKLFCVHHSRITSPISKSPSLRKGTAVRGYCLPTFLMEKGGSIWKYQCLTLPRKRRTGNHDDPHSHPEGSLSLLSALRAGLAGPLPSGCVRGCDGSYSTGSAG